MGLLSHDLPRPYIAAGKRRERSMTGERADDRTVLGITGSERHDFLQGLVSNDIDGLARGAVYAAVLTPQGKYLADFFLVEDGDRILLDVKSDIAAALAQRLSMYKLRADVAIAETGLHVSRGLGTPPEGAHAPTRATPISAGAATPPIPAPSPPSTGTPSASPTASPRPGSSWSRTRPSSSKPGSSASTASISARAAMSGRRSPPG
jgi:hypothetical protein